MSHPYDDLLWTAYRYSAGELSAAESLRFEEQLATDQAAREALASAVALSETVCAIEREVAPSRPIVMPATTTRRSWLQPAGWVTVAAAACLALTFAWRGPAPEGIRVPQLRPETAVKVEPADAETELLLALLEGGNRVDGNDEEKSILVPSLNSEPLHDELLPDDVVELALDVIQQGADGNESDLEDQNAAPDWIMAAVVESKS
jgi:hypothetical protein